MKQPVPVKVWTEFNHDWDLPQYETLGASGLDVRANMDYTIQPASTALIPTGIYMAVPDGYEVQVRPRSGLSLKTSFRIANSPGTIDADYRGELCIIATNTSNISSFGIAIGDRIAQIVLMEVPKIEWVPVAQKADLPPTIRGEGGFGSTS
jgi:dUTP pyrophosphatase